MNKNDISNGIIVFVIFLLITAVCIGIIWKKNSNSFGGMPEMGLTGRVGAGNMEFIGQLLGSGQMYCMDNVGIELVSMNSNYTTWVSMKEFCEIIDENL